MFEPPWNAHVLKKGSISDLAFRPTQGEIETPIRRRRVPTSSPTGVYDQGGSLGNWNSGCIFYINGASRIMTLLCPKKTFPQALGHLNWKEQCGSQQQGQENVTNGSTTLALSRDNRPERVCVRACVRACVGVQQYGVSLNKRKTR